MVIQSSNIYLAWCDLLRVVMDSGAEVSPRGMKVREILGTCLKVTDLRNNIIVHPARDLNYRFMIAEWLWMLAGRDDVRTVVRYNSQIAKFSDDGVVFQGAYGPRLMGQWDYVAEALRTDMDSRQAVTAIWSPCPPKSKDIPCTLTAQFFIRGGKLHAVWSMRSNDLWLGLPYDFFNFSMLTNGLAALLGVESGSLQLNTGSSHIYETNFETVKEVLEKQQAGEYVRSPRLLRWPYADLILTAVDLIEDTFKDSYFDNPYERGYAEALHLKTKAGALEVLRGMSEAKV
jgi:thymidylate synthase